MNTIDEPKEPFHVFWLRYWPVICCPIIAVTTWNGPSAVALLFAMMALREHRQWRGLWSPIICFVICFGCIISSGVAALMHLVR